MAGAAGGAEAGGAAAAQDDGPVGHAGSAAVGPGAGRAGEAGALDGVRLAGPGAAAASGAWTAGLAGGDPGAPAVAASGPGAGGGDRRVPAGKAGASPAPAGAPAPPVIDAHVHYWRPERGDHGWMPPDDPVLSRAYLPADLAPQLAAGGVAAVVLVQAAPTLEETAWMLGVADATPHVAGVVGWVDFEAADAPATLARLRRHPKFLGVRPMIQDIADVDWMLRPDVGRTLAAVADLDLSFDALGHPRHLANFATLLAGRPGLRLVVDHAMKPTLRDWPAGQAAWAEGIARLADLGACCKLSGLVTEAGPDWTVDALAPAADHLLACFGPDRLMWGSDWPVCRLRAEWTDWRAAAGALTADLDKPARAAVFGGAAAAFYRLGG